MARESLFNAVKALKEERERRHKDMMSFMSGLDGYGKLGYAIGTGLAKLFGVGEAEAAAEERTAQNKNEYVRAYMAATPEQRPYLFDRGLQEFPDYAIQVKEYQDEQNAAAAEAERTARLMQIKEIELDIKQAEARQFDTKPLTEPQQEYYSSRIGEVAEELDVKDSWWDPTDGLSRSDEEIIIENAEMLRRSNKAINMTPRQALKLAMQDYINGGNVQKEAEAKSQVEAQQIQDILSTAKD